MSATVSTETLMSKFPPEWVGLCAALCGTNRQLAAAELWLRGQRDSAYGPGLSWRSLLEALTENEPVIVNGQLKL